MQFINSAPIKKGTRVFVRCDLDVPIEGDKIGESYRVEQSIPTLKLILEKGGLPIIAGHMGRPKSPNDSNLSTKLLKPFFDNALGLNNYELLENLRFNAGEESNNVEFAKELASQAEIYVNESFATSHRAHASMVGVASLLPSFAGLRLAKEIQVLSDAMKNPKRPLIAIIGGAKLDSKKPVVEKFLQVADGVLIGGRIGLDWHENIPTNLFLPVDYFGEDKDIGEKTINHYKEMIASAKTIIWSGPLGMFEDPNFAKGTKSVAEAIVQSSAFSIVGGGDVIHALRQVGYLQDMGFISTGGSAMLEFLVKGNLPALEAIGYHG